MRVCPFCGTENEVFFRFCLGCGADLDEALGPVEPEAPAPAPTPAPAPAAPAAKAKTDAAPPAPDASPTQRSGARVKPAPPQSQQQQAPQTPEEPLPSTMVRHRHEPPPRRPTAVEPKGPPGRGHLVLILEDGTDGASYELGHERTVVGREGADINFPHDDFLGPKHAEFNFAGAQLTLSPLKSTNGVFVQVSHEVELRSGDVFRIGQELLCFELLGEVLKSSKPVSDGVTRLGSPVPEGAWGRLGQLVAPDAWGAVYLLGGSDIYLGRERGDITFPADGFVSGLHAVIMQRDGRYFLKDLGSSNGTYYRLSKPAPVRRGSLVLAGQQLFRVEM
ncbi:MAG: FHA domain-containing protein [Deltaproteobacteria bacterium]|nr:FHA domain-containing protein [Deltaproteobacteria bacterium]